MGSYCGGCGALHEEDDDRLCAACEKKKSSDKLVPLESLDFAVFRMVNRARCVQAFHPVEAWTPSDWAMAACGELGELCNLLKKRRRGEIVADEDLAREAADTVTYLDLLCERLGIDLGRAVRAKFNEVSDRKGCSIKLPEPGQAVVG